MKKNKLITGGLLALLLGFSLSSKADDIDIYSGLGTGASMPNIMIVFDNGSNSNATMGSACSYDAAAGGGAPPQSTKSIGYFQCALVNLIYGMTKQADGTALFRLGITTMSGADFPLTPLDDSAYTGPSTVTISGNSITMPGGLTNRQAIIYAVKQITTTSGSANQGAELQETWAYYTGGNGGTTGVGLLSGRTYGTPTNATSGCQKNYNIFLSGVTSSAHAVALPSGGELTKLHASALNALALLAYGTDTSLTNTKYLKLDPSASGYTGTIPSKPEAGYGIEWARFMNSTDVNYGSYGIQSIATYSVATGNTAVPPNAITDSMELYIKAVGDYGGGQYFAAGTDSSVVTNDIKKILNEIQAVNSVFSSSSLPVSVNAQGTFLNQIYMGMFRPDEGSLPRWPGNVKQYQFILDPTTKALTMGDSKGDKAINGDTGFITPDAISFWTSADLSSSTTNAYVTTLTSLHPEKTALLIKNNQNFTDLTSGFWKNNPSSADASAGAFDLADGQLVERGGAAQQIRRTNLTDDYTTAAGTTTNPRKLYTWCAGGGTSCQSALTHTDNAFATTNTALVSTSFGSTLTANISTLTRSYTLFDTTVNVSTTANHGFSTGDSIGIANATPANYNGTYTITKVDATHFTYTIPVYPPTIASGNYSATKPSGGTSRSVTGLAYSSNWVTVTAPAHGFTNGATVTIAGATPTAYNGGYTITYIDANTFKYQLTEQPPTVGGSGTSSSIVKSTGSGCPCSDIHNINAWNAASPGLQRTLGSTTVTVTTDTILDTTANHRYLVGNSVTISGLKDSAGNLIAAYNGTFVITAVSGYTFSFATTVSPSGAVSGVITATSVIPQTITSLTRVNNTATATIVAHGYSPGDSIVIGVASGGSAGANESAYQGTFTIANVTTNTFDYTVATTPTSPATGLSGATMTATRSSGLNSTNLNDLINWTRGYDNQNDETSLCPTSVTTGTLNCPTPRVTVRPSVHGDVLHSRPTVINYGSYPVTITATSDSGTTRTATASSTEVTTISTFGAYPIVTFANGQACPVTVASSTTFSYLASSCGASGAQSATVGSKVVVFYGDNGGVFHAVNGNQSSNFSGARPGEEMWGFIPADFFIKLNRLRTNSPQLNLPSTPAGITPAPRIKDYFIDGSPGVYQLIDGTGTTTKAVLYLAMRRGGNFLYALDVTTPSSPTILWKVDNTGLTEPTGTFTSNTEYSELGQTWSQPKVARVKGYCGGVACSSSVLPTPVLIFGGGYDVKEDDEPPSANSSGRAIFVLDALTGAIVWKATYTSAGSTSYSTGTAYKGSASVSGMNYGIPSDITLMDSDQDGYIDRLYAADVGGNIWRVDLQPSGLSTPNNWKIYQFAALGCLSGACSIPTATSQRKFFYPPEVISHTSTYNYDAVIVGSGDREHPLYVSTSTQRRNRIMMLKDTYTGDNANGMTPVTVDSLFDAGTVPASIPYDGTMNGYSITLAAGEKVVNAPLVAAGYVYMGTNQPKTASSTECSNLGIATGYILNPFAGTYQSVEFAGGGLPPSPVSGVVNIVEGGVVKQMPFLIGGGNPDCVGADCKSALGGQKPPINVSTKRSRTYRYIENK